MRGLRVKCLSCCGIFHETTERFDPFAMLNGTMFKLLPKYGPKGENWSSFPQDTAIRDADLECPQCGSPYLGNMKLEVESGYWLCLPDLRKELREREQELVEIQDLVPAPGQNARAFYERMEWKELKRLSMQKGIFKVGKNRQKLIEDLVHEKEAQEAGAENS